MVHLPAGVTPGVPLPQRFYRIGPPSSSLYAESMATLLDMCAYLSMRIAEHKCDSPTPYLTFQGIEVDTVADELHLPAAPVGRL